MDQNNPMPTDPNSQEAPQVTNATVSAGPVMDEPKSWLVKNKRLVIILGVVLAVVLLAGIYYVFMRKDKANSPSPQPQTSETSIKNDSDLRAAIETINSTVDKDTEELKSLDSYLKD